MQLILYIVAQLVVNDMTTSSRVHLARLEDSSGRIPLEYAMTSPPLPLDSVRILMLAYPEGLLHKCPFTGNTPIMTALEDNFPEQYITAMLHSHPACLQVRNNDMKLPIHFACWKSRKFSSAVILEILNAFQEVRFL